jgi:hypothetical protein
MTYRSYQIFRNVSVQERMTGVMHVWYRYFGGCTCPVRGEKVAGDGQKGSEAIRKFRKAASDPDEVHITPKKKVTQDEAKGG